VFVTKKQERAGVRYSYRVLNGSKSPVTTLLIGYDYFQRAAELPMGPVGLSDAGVPKSSVSSPAGWEFEIIDSEQGELIQFEWATRDTSRSIAGGHSMRGFSVLLPKACEKNETGHWTVYLDSAHQLYYSASLKPETSSTPRRN
jgi:hypothetical protein